MAIAAVVGPMIGEALSGGATVADSLQRMHQLSRNNRVGFVVRPAACAAKCDGRGGDGRGGGGRGEGGAAFGFRVRT